MEGSKVKVAAGTGSAIDAESFRWRVRRINTGMILYLVIADIAGESHEAGMQV